MGGMALSRTSRVTLSGMGFAVLLAFAHGVNDAFTNILPVYLPILQEQFALDAAVLASFVAVNSLSANVMQPFMGALSDRWGRRRTAAFGLIVGSVLMSFVGQMPSVIFLYLLLLVGGLGSAIFHPAAASMSRDSISRKGLAVGLFTAGGPLGTALMPVVVLYIIRRFGMPYVPWLALLGVIVGIMLFVLSPQQTRARGIERPKLFDWQLIKGPVGLLALAGIMRALAFISFINAMPLYLVNVRGLAPDAALIGWTLAVYSAAASAGVLLSGALEHRFGRRRLAVGSMLLALPLALLVLTLPIGSAAYFVTIALGGLCTNAAIPLLLVSAQDLAPKAVATASGLLMGFTWGTAGVLYIGIGFLQQSLGIVSAMIVGFAFLIPAAMLAFWVLGKYRERLSV